MAQNVYRARDVERHYERVQEREAKEQDLGRSALGEEIKKELDDLLDEIDEVLVENAETFVRDFVQGGGE